MCGLMSKRIESQRSSRVDLQFDNYRVKWLIYNASSPVASAESIVASQDHRKKREDQTESKFRAQVSVKRSLPLKEQETPSVQP